jgi:hypothetical protein
MTPERVEGDRNIFWRVEEERGRGGVVTHYVRLTTSLQHASTFFIRPDYRYDIHLSRFAKSSLLLRRISSIRCTGALIGSFVHIRSNITLPFHRKMGRYFFITTYDTNGSTATDDQQQPQCSEQPH